MATKRGDCENDFLAKKRAGQRQYLCAHINTFEGQQFFHLRLWHDKDGRGLRPGKVGLTLKPEYFMTVLEVMEEARDELKRRVLQAATVGQSKGGAGNGRGEVV